MSDGRRPSGTAELMSVQRALESRHPFPERLFSDPLADQFVSWRWRVVLAAAHLGSARRLIECLYQRIGGPGPRASAVARTRLIDDLLAEASSAATQIVILGAGFDTRAYRLPTLAHCRVFEVDHPATQVLKRNRLARIPSTRTAAVTYVPVDFEHDELAGVLADGGYDPQLPSVFVWEGVTNYLTADAVGQTLGAINQLARPGSTLVLTYVDQAALDAASSSFPEAARWIKGVSKRGEPWIFGLDPSTLADYLSVRGFRLTGDLSTAEAGDRYFPQHHRTERGSRLYHVATATVAKSS